MTDIKIDSYAVPEHLGEKMLDLALEIELDIARKHPDIPISIIRDIVAHTFNSFAWQIHEMVKQGDKKEGPPTLIQ